MHRFIRHSLLIGIAAVAFSGQARATVITMNTPATFTGGQDLTIDSSDNDTSTRLTSTLNGASSTIDFTTAGQVDWLALGTLRLGEGIAIGNTTPNILAAEYNDGYRLAIDVNTNLGLLSFIANSGLFTTFLDSGTFDADTTDTDAEITVNLASLSQQVTVGLITFSLSIVDNEFSNTSVLAFNQNTTAATVWLKAEVLRVDEPNPSETAEVGTMAMLGSGLLALGAMARRRKSPRLDVKFA
jgi:hypothetical protein